jgi:dTDP-4-dehydrorhamnose 3,5-epimerase
VRTKPLDLPGLVKIYPHRHGDDRGFFAETYSYRDYEKLGIDTIFVQDNHSLSASVGTIRGLHFQSPPNAQAKLVRCGQGAIFDVAVDIRRGSPTFGHWAGCTLSAENGAQLYIPVGFAHGFAALEPNSEIIYKCSDYYAPETEGVLRWNDSKVGIAWPDITPRIISKKDSAAPLWGDFSSPFTFMN